MAGLEERQGPYRFRFRNHGEHHFVTLFAWHGFVAEDSGRIVWIGGGRFRRSHEVQYGAQGRVPECLARHSVGLERGHNLGRIVLLAA